MIYVRVNCGKKKQLSSISDEKTELNRTVRYLPVDLHLLQSPFRLFIQKNDLLDESHNSEREREE